jgi:hypothetical protein
MPVIAATNVNELALLTVTNTATDSDIHSTLSYALLAPPAGAAISATGVITWTPAQTQSPSTNTITVAAISTDPDDLVNPEVASISSFTVVVKEVNVAPVLPALPTNFVNELALLTVTNAATESNIHATLAYGLAAAPSGMVISTNGVITWTPAGGPSTNLITTVVTNTDAYDLVNTHLTATNTFAVVVFAPTLAPISNRTVNAGQTVTFTAVAADNDPARTLTYSLGAGAPAAATIGAASGLFNWRVPVADANTTNTIQVEATANSAPVVTVTNSFTVTVNPLASVDLAGPTFAAEQAQIKVTGPIGPDYILQASVYLTNGTWTDLLTNTPSASPFTLTDTNAASYTKRFYRIQLGP